MELSDYALPVSLSALDRQIVPLSPLVPRPIIVPELVMAKAVQGKQDARSGDATIAIGDYPAVLAHSSFVEERSLLGERLPGAVRLHKRLGGNMLRAGNVTTAATTLHTTAKLPFITSVNDGRSSITKAGQQVVRVDAELRTYGRMESSRSDG
jgi:hypothetical protein